MNIFYRNLIFIMLVCTIPVLLLSSCRKEEQGYHYKFGKKPPPATDRDTVISVTAKLNGADFSALGRSLKPDSIIRIYFFDFTSNAFLEVVLGNDTVGTYTMGRSISSSTAVYYTDPTSKQSNKGFTSRATDSAGGYVKITEIDTLNHKLKGEFELLLLSRTDSSRYEFKQGSFDLLYNYGEILIDDTIQINADKIAILSEGQITSPTPVIDISFPDSSTLRIDVIRFQGYKGTGEYAATPQSQEIIYTDNRTGKKYNKVISGKLNIIRYNFKEFTQGSIENCVLETENGERKTIKQGSFVWGNTN